MAIFLLFSSTVLSYPNRLHRQKYRFLGMIMPELPSLIRDDTIWQDKLLSNYGKIFDRSAKILK
jgi:hypothetical protein